MNKLALVLRIVPVACCWFCALRTCGCVETSIPPPPHDVFLASVPEADLKVWDQAIGAWNDVVGSTVLARVYAPPRCGVYVYADVEVDGSAIGEAWPYVDDGVLRRNDDCITVVRYERGRVWCTAAHEAGHILGLEHTPGDTDVMSADGCTFVLPNSRNGAAVRDRWEL